MTPYFLFKGFLLLSGTEFLQASDIETSGTRKPGGKPNTPTSLKTLETEFDELRRTPATEEILAPLDAPLGSGSPLSSVSTDVTSRGNSPANQRGVSTSRGDRFPASISSRLDATHTTLPMPHTTRTSPDLQLNVPPSSIQERTSGATTTPYPVVGDVTFGPIYSPVTLPSEYDSSGALVTSSSYGPRSKSSSNTFPPHSSIG